MSAPRVGVVILTWNDGDLLDAAVRSVLESVDVDAEVVVIDNGSDPPAVVPDDQRVRLIRNPTNRGVAAARNQGAAVLTSRLLLFLDSDARLRPHTLQRLCQAIEGAPDVAVAAPVFAGQLPEASAGRAPGVARKVARLAGVTARYARSRPSSPLRTKLDMVDDEWDVDFAIGACQLIRRELFDRVGGLDEGFFYGPEDVDFCLRIKELGWRVLQVGVACDHPPRRRNRRLLTRRGLRHGWAVIRYLWRHRQPSHLAT
ncbi:MAG TPA: glycosyltransferase family 2 protein [Acidimicrobiales bacterium]|nr:glycosyltransferase family 2 protein [Acidimicrobiales bacterium]